MMHNFYAERTGVNLAYVSFHGGGTTAVAEAVRGAYALKYAGDQRDGSP